MTTKNLNQSLVDAAKKTIHEERSKATDEARSNPGILGGRIHASKELAKGERVKKVQYKIDPERCRLWEEHNRIYDLLNEERCADLIDGFKSMGKQEFPAIVRRIEGDESYDYEVICGARRHWTASYLGWKLLVEVRELDDEQAFRLADIENRDREDISDYERALDYSKALTNYYSNQKQMAERLEVSVDWLSRFLALAKLPDEIIKAYRDITDIRVAHYRQLAKGLKVESSKQRILAKAKELGGKGLDGQQVISALVKEIAPPKRKKQPLARYKTKSGEPMITVDKKGRGGLSIVVEPGCGASKDEVKNALVSAVEEFYG